MAARVTGVQRYAGAILPFLEGRYVGIQPEENTRGFAGHLWEQFLLPGRVGKNVLWSPGNTGPLTVRRQVVTVHDATTLDHPEWFDRKFAAWYRLVLPRLVKKVHGIITVSHFSKERIVATTGADPDRIHVIHNGVEPRFAPAPEAEIARVRVQFDLNAPYCLYVGSLEPRKNLKTLLEAWKSGKFAGATLAIAGGCNSIFAESTCGPVPEGVRFLGRVEDVDLPALYSGALAFVYPSVYEGFGLPLLEAMACGCPVVISDIPPHREVCDSAATYFDPTDPEEMAGKIQFLMELNAESRAAIVAAGIQRASEFSWERSAVETWRVLEEAAA